jgi:hypothetical protein
MQSDGGFPDVFFGVFLLLWFVVLLSYAVGIAALISVARLPTEAFGPWWDNTKQSWVIGLVVAFLLPCGTVVAGISWFVTGKGALRRGLRVVGRPFWAGPIKPVPYGYAPPGPAQYRPGPPPPPPGGPTPS